MVTCVVGARQYKLSAGLNHELCLFIAFSFGVLFATLQLNLEGISQVIWGEANSGVAFRCVLVNVGCCSLLMHTVLFRLRPDFR
jgi:hypothetical protein